MQHEQMQPCFDFSCRRPKLDRLWLNLDAVGHNRSSWCHSGGTHLSKLYAQDYSTYFFVTFPFRRLLAEKYGLQKTPQ